MSKYIFNTDNDLVKGEKHLIFLCGLPIAYAKGEDFKMSPEAQDVSSKISGEYKQTTLSTLNWSSNVDAIVSDTQGHMSYELLKHLAARGKDYPFEYCKIDVEELEDGSRQITKVKVLMKGRVTVGDVGQKSSRGEYETCSVVLNGNGKLTDGADNKFGSIEALRAIGITLDEKGFVVQGGSESESGD